MLPTLAKIDMELAIWAEDTNISSWVALCMLLLLIVEMTTPGMARNPTFAVSITVDWNINRVRLEISSLDAAQRHTQRISSSHSSNNLVMNLFQTFSMMISSVHNFSIS